MLSLRLPDEQLVRINALSRAQGLTRSQWLRQLVEKALAAADARPDPHRYYLEIMAGLEAEGAVLDSGKSDLGLAHSVRLKEKLRAKHHR